MHLNLVLSHFLSSSHLILPLQCWINFKGRWSQKSLTLALLMDSQQPCTARAVTCTVTQIYHGAEGKGVFVYLLLCWVHCRDICRDYCIEEVLFTSSCNCLPPPVGACCNAVCPALLRELKGRIFRVCLGEGMADKWPETCITWGNDQFSAARNHILLPHSLLPELPVLVFRGSHLWDLRQSQKNEKTLFFFLRVASLLLPIIKKAGQSTNETHLNNVHPQVLPQSVFILWPAKIREVGVRYHQNKMIHCREKIIL